MSAMVQNLSLLLLRELDALRREVELYPTDEALWRQLPGLPNPGGTLVLHLVGNLRYFIGGAIGRTGYERDREAEFTTREVSRSDLLELIARTRQEVAAALLDFDPATLPPEFPATVGGMSLPSDLFLLHLLSHLGYHLGQIDYHRRASTGNGASANALPVSALRARPK
jgi:hypothetical protein